MSLQMFGDLDPQLDWGDPRVVARRPDHVCVAKWLLGEGLAMSPAHTGHEGAWRAADGVRGRLAVARRAALRECVDAR